MIWKSIEDFPAKVREFVECGDTILVKTEGGQIFLATVRFEQTPYGCDPKKIYYAFTPMAGEYIAHDRIGEKLKIRKVKWWAEIPQTEN